MYQIKVKGLKELQADISDLIKHRIPKITAIALTETAKTFKDSLIKEMQRVFDRPKPWTLGGVYFQSATPRNLNAPVWFKDELATGSGTPAVKYLWPQVHGGPRREKRYEMALRHVGILPAGWFTVPGDGARIDAYGNMSNGQIVQILTAMRALRGLPTIRGVLAPFRKGKGTREYFAAIPDVLRTQHLAPGIYERYGSGKRKSRPVLIFVKGAPQYSVRLPFYDLAQAWIDIEFPKIFNRLADETLAYHLAKRKAA